MKSGGKIIVAVTVLLMLVVAVVVGDAKAAALVSIDVEQITSSSAVLDLDGSTEPGSSCVITVASAGVTEQQIDCSSWTGGPEQIPVSNLSANTDYTATVNLNTPDGDYPWAEVSFTTAKPSQPLPPTRPGCQVKSCGHQPTQPRAQKLNLIVACSKHRLSARDHRCSIESGAVAKIGASRYGTFKLCLRYPVSNDALGGALYKTACTHWQTITGHRPVILSLRKRLPVAFRWPRLGITSIDETVSVVTPGHGLYTPSAVQTVYFHA